MKHCTKLLAIALLLPLVSLAQSNYKPGYVITSNGDTVRGFIDYQSWASNPSSISFKAAIADRGKKIFKIGDMRLFNVTGLAVYEKYVCSVSMDTRNTSNLGSRDTTFRIDTVLLRVLQKGKNVALYTYTDGLKTRFYTGETPNFVPVELIYRIYNGTDANGNSTMITENDYQKQLFAIANKYNALDDRLTQLLERSGYDSDDLLLIISHINNISKSEFDTKYAHHGKITWYGGLALNISQTTSSSSTSYSTFGGVGHTSYLPSIKFGVDLLPDADGRAEFKVELSVNLAQFTATYPLNVIPYGNAVASYNQNSIALTPQALYNIYNTPNFKFYLGAGLSFGYYSYTNPEFHAQNPSTTNDFPVEPYYFNTINFPFLLKAGFRIHRNLDIYFDYYTGVTTTRGGYFGFNNESKQVGINYSFGK